MRHRKLGRQLTTFRHTLTWTFLATIIFLLLMFILNAGIGKDIRASGDPANAVGWFNILFIAWYGIYVVGQFRSRLTLYEHGFILQTLFKEHVVVYREIRGIKSKFSQIESPGSFMHARIDTPQGRVLLKNNWKPRRDFYNFIAQFLFQDDEDDVIFH